MTDKQSSQGAPLAAIAARKRKGAELRERDAERLRREADELDAELARRTEATA